MTQPLFVLPDVEFEKIGSEATLPEDPNQWPTEIVQELYKQVPYVAEFEPHVQMQRVDAERGYGFGHVQVSNQTEAQTGASPDSMESAGVREVRVPVIIKDRKLQPFDLLVTDDSSVKPLTEMRLRTALFRPQMFDVTSKTPGDQSLIGSLYPPYRQNYGFGGGGMAMNVGMGKASSALEGYLEEGMEKNADAIDDYFAADKLKHGRMGKTSETRSLKHLEKEAMVKELRSMLKQSAARMSEKTGSVLQAILPTINASHYNDLFNSLQQDPYLQAAFVKNAAATAGALKLIASAEPTTLEKTAEVISSLIRPDVIQVSRVDEGYLVKSANSKYWKPETCVLNRGEVVRALGNKVALAADLSGQATIAEGAETEAPNVETQQAEPVAEPGLYKVQTSEGKELVGVVIPNLFDVDGEQLPISLFTNGSQSAVQADIEGISAGETWELPSGPPSGTGAFYDITDGGVLATIPITLGGSSSTPEEPELKTSQGETFDGRPVEVSVQPNIQAVVGTEDGKMLVPAHWKWLPLGDSAEVSLAGGEDEENKQAAAMRSFASVTVRSGDYDVYSIDGPAVEKLAHDEREFINLDGAMFLLAGLGVEQGYGAQKLAEAHLGAAPVQVRIGRYIQPVEVQLEKAKEAAAERLADFPVLRKVLLKEAAVIPDPTAVDTVLSLGFINPENIMTFVGYLPVVEDSQTKLCELLLASRLGMNDVPSSALEKAVRSTEEVLEGLKILAFQQ